MKKICFVTTISLTLKVFVLKTAEYIHNNTDWDISFICSNDDEFKAMLPAYIHYYPVQMERGISMGGIKAMLEMKKIFKREKFYLIQYSTPNASLYASLAGKMAGIPVRLYCQWGMAFVGFQGIKRKIFKAEEKLVCSLSTHIEPDSNSNLVFSHEEGLYPESKGYVIWNGSACGVDLNKFDIHKKEEYRNKIRTKCNIPDDAFVFGFVGRITRDKGINELLSAFKKIFTGKEFLLLVGPSEIDSTVNEDLISWSNSNDNIIFTGYTSVVEQYLSAMDCYILPSYREGFGIGVIEAEAMGVPVIVTNIPGPIDAMIDGETGIVVKKADSELLQHAMETMKNDRVLTKKYGDNGCLFSRQNFDQQILFEKLLYDRKELLREV
ncbi:MAG: glycosyltransferase [Candidatus Fimimorpha sp.]